MVFSKNQASFLGLASVTMGSGIALVIAVLAEFSLGWLLFIFTIFAITTFLLRWRRSTLAQRQQILKRVKVGCIAGLVATAAYDLSRLLIVYALSLNVWPFEAFLLFGQLIAGADVSVNTAYLVGTIYHVCNGVFFTIAYCLAFGRKHWAFGILWALGLEVAMLVLYPSWLTLDGVMQEFTVMSMTGHLTYGAVLGFLSHRGLSSRT